MVRLAWFLAIAAAAMVGKAALANEIVPFIAGSEIPENDGRAIVKDQETFFDGRHDSDAFGIPMRERSMTLAQAKRWFRNEKLLVGYADIDGDGQDEMLAYIRGLGFCGSAGATRSRSESVEGNGKSSRDYTAIPEGWGVRLFITENMTDGHRTFYAAHTAWEWTGDKYRSVDLKDCRLCNNR